MQWFLKEQVEEVATMSDLLKVVERGKDNPLLVEEYLARETPGDEGRGPDGARGGRRRRLDPEDRPGTPLWHDRPLGRSGGRRPGIAAGLPPRLCRGARST